MQVGSSGYSTPFASTFENICLYGANFEGVSLRGTDFSLAFRDHLVITKADLTKTYFKADYIPDRRAKNFTDFAKSKTELNQLE